MIAMNWETYSEEFTEAALDNGFNNLYVERCLKYAKRLHSNNLPIIYSIEHLGYLIGFQSAYLRFASYTPQKFYRTFEIKKKAGGTRKISEPLPNLKIIQRWILEKILYQIEPSQYAKAFVPNRSIKENARFHRAQPMVLTVDVQNFFPSLSVSRVNSLFKSWGYSSSVSYYLTRLCTLDGGLPQGSPSSPALSNLIFSPLDNKIGDYCKESSIRYTRYADDLTFSGGFSASNLISYVRQVLSALDLELNENKTRLMRKHERQEVTGVVVNEKLQATRELRRDLRQAVYYIEKYGLNNHLARIGEVRANYLFHLMGLATFALFINPKDRDAEKAITALREENKKKF